MTTKIKEGNVIWVPENSISSQSMAYPAMWNEGQ